MKQKIDVWKKLKKYQMVICVFLFFGMMLGLFLGKFDSFLIYGVALLFYWNHVTMDPETRKKMAAARFKSGFSDPQDLSNPSGFTNPTSPAYHMHNSKSISSSFEK